MSTKAYKGMVAMVLLLGNLVNMSIEYVPTDMTNAMEYNNRW